MREAMGLNTRSDKRDAMKTSGRKCSELLPKSAPLGSLARMFVESSVWNSTKCLLTWKPLVTKQQRLLFQLAPSTPRIEGIEYGLLATPNTMDAMAPKTDKAALKEATVTRPGRTKYGNLLDQVYRGVAMLPTPRSGKTTNENRESWEARQKDGKVATPPLALAIQMLPTPKSQNANVPALHGQGGMDLQTKIQVAHDWVQEKKDMEELMNGTNRGLKLQPAFVEWMQGFPIGWTDLKPSETP